MGRYEVWYNGYVYYGDNDDWNCNSFSNWEDANREYTYLTSVGVECYLKDTEYGVTLCNGEWN